MGVLDEPFRGAWAVAAGYITEWQLRKDFEQVFPGVHVRKGVVLNAVGRAQAAVHWSKGDAVVVGRSAAAMHETPWIDAQQAVELGSARHLKPPNGIRIYRDTYEPHECCDIDGFRVTTPARTAFDIGRRLPRDEAIPIIDALCRATNLLPREIAALAAEHAGARGVRRIAQLVPLIDPGAESIQESLTRLLLIDDGLPPPRTQVLVRDPYTGSRIYIDMGWEEWRVGVEYDGRQHWDDAAQRRRDIDRLEALRALDWRIIRLSASHLYRRPHLILDRIREALRARGAQLD
ncbi:endonuclease domain-containing protein [Nocardia mexicana]|uniref:Uncharacterized protein DUF559 n=1 Tax=Nocardia mexicana TaxID=279262 RepID=A0A370H6W0_9NOCA|nr:DUF559 domain-containing protein [Nocardia mexicana]RDI51841.1 uncharacterized protein DUF559 [Nocardia mexicana]